MTITGSSSAIIATIRRPRRRSPASPTRASSRSRSTADGPTTKADCLNHLYDALIAYETRDRTARPRRSCSTTPRTSSIRFELRIFDGLIDRAAVIQLPVLPLPDPHSRWISGHYCDEFAEAHIKELVVREAVGAAIPLAGVGCAIAREPLAQLAAMQDGKPFAGASMTEDYELGPAGSARSASRRCSCASRRSPASAAWSPAAAISRRRSAPRSARRRAGSAASRLPAGTGSAGAAASASAGCGCATAAGRSPRCCCSRPMARRCCGRSCGSPKRSARRSRRGSIPTLVTLLTINAWLLAWRVLMRACFTASAYGWREGLLSIPRLVVGNVIAMLAAARARLAAPRRRRRSAGTRPATSSRPSLPQ